MRGLTDATAVGFVFALFTSSFVAAASAGISDAPGPGSRITCMTCPKIPHPSTRLIDILMSFETRGDMAASRNWFYSGSIVRQAVSDSSVLIGLTTKVHKTSDLPTHQNPYWFNLSVQMRCIRVSGGVGAVLQRSRPGKPEASEVSRVPRSERPITI